MASLRFLSIPIIALAFSAGSLLAGEDAPPPPPPAPPAPVEPPPVPKPDPKRDWHGRLGMGFSISQGNTENYLFSVNANFEKLIDPHQLRLGADAAAGNAKVNGVDTTSASNAHIFADYKYLVTGDLYGGARFDLSHDDLAALKYRAMLGPSVGYFLVRNDAVKLNVEASPSLVLEKKGDVSKTYAALRLSERLEYKINPTWKLWEGVDFIPEVDRPRNFLVTAELGTEVGLTSILSLQLTAMDKFVNEPTAGKKQNDFTALTAVVLKF
jgi:putative salt-induced outer membrane protein YdiY